MDENIEKIQNKHNKTNSRSKILICFGLCVVVICGMFITIKPTKFNLKELVAIQQIKLPSPAAAKFVNTQPHVIYFLADDLGWNDVGYHGSFVQTPTIDELASEGVKLERFYMNPICTPSRAALLSGRYITHTGLQHMQIQTYQPNGLSLNCTLLPQALKEYGYKNYLIGKWHLGYYKEEYTPQNRGFDKFFGIYPGMAGHYDRREYGKYALIDNGQPYWDNTTYDTRLYVQKTVDYIEEHLREHPDKPMFMLVSFQAVHQPIEVPKYYSDRYRNITSNAKQRLVAGMTTAMDEGIKNITKVFKEHGIWENAVTFFSTDNGGMVEFGSSNYPLFNGKASLFEGGIRGVAFARGKGIRPGRVSNSLMHMTDIYPTILNLAKPHALKSNDKELSDSLNRYIKTLDGYNLWDTISNDASNPRKEVLINMDTYQKALGRITISRYLSHRHSISNYC